MTSDEAGRIKELSLAYKNHDWLIRLSTNLAEKPYLTIENIKQNQVIEIWWVCTDGGIHDGQNGETPLIQMDIPPYIIKKAHKIFNERRMMWEGLKIAKEILRK